MLLPPQQVDVVVVVAALVLLFVLLLQVEQNCRSAVCLGTVVWVPDQGLASAVAGLLLLRIGSEAEGKDEEEKPQSLRRGKNRSLVVVLLSEPHCSITITFCTTASTAARWRHDDERRESCTPLAGSSLAMHTTFTFTGLSRRHDYFASEYFDVIEVHNTIEAPGFATT